jgi:hypothetical protein
MNEIVEEEHSLIVGTILYQKNEGYGKGGFLLIKVFNFGKKRMKITELINRLST